MPSTNSTIILTRTSQCLAAAALMTGLAFGATPIAYADWDQAGFDKCVTDTVDLAGNDREYQWLLCCQQNGGTPSKDDAGIGCNRDTSPPLSAPTDPTGKPGVIPPQVGADASQAPGAPPIGPVPLVPGNARG
jgi:hypothetical protein